MKSLTGTTCILFSFLLILTPFQVVESQTLGRLEQTNSNVGSYYYFVQPGAATIQVQVLGMVRSPGLYEVHSQTDLSTLMALTGGPLMAAERRGQKREVIIRVFSQTASESSDFREIRFEEALSDPRSAYPVLGDGDIVTVEVRERSTFVFRDILSGVNAFALAIIAFDRLFRWLS